MTLLFWLWAGMVFGISFVATPAKFLAVSVPLIHLLDVGRVTFEVMSYIEGFLLLALGVVTFLNRHQVSKGLWLAFMIVLISLSVNYLWLKPALELRSQPIPLGQDLNSFSYHQLYVAIEFIKLLALLTGGYLSRSSSLKTLN